MGSCPYCVCVCTGVLLLEIKPNKKVSQPPIKKNKKQKSILFILHMRKTVVCKVKCLIQVTMGNKEHLFSHKLLRSTNDLPGKVVLELVLNSSLKIMSWNQQASHMRMFTQFLKMTYSKKCFLFENSPTCLFVCLFIYD